MKPVHWRVISPENDNFSRVWRADIEGVSLQVNHRYFGGYTVSVESFSGPHRPIEVFGFVSLADAKEMGIYIAGFAATLAGLYAGKKKRKAGAR